MFAQMFDRTEHSIECSIEYSIQTFHSKRSIRLHLSLGSLCATTALLGALAPAAPRFHNAVHGARLRVALPALFHLHQRVYV